MMLGRMPSIMTVTHFPKDKILMDATVPANFVMWLLGFLVSLLGGCWAIFKYFESKLNRLYQRMDDNKKSYYNDFVLKEVLKESNDSKKQIIDEKFDGLIKLFNEKIEGLRNEIRIIINHRKGE